MICDHHDLFLEFYAKILQKILGHVMIATDS